MERINILNRFPTKVIYTKKLQEVLQYLPGQVRRKKRWKKAKILMEVEMTGSILSSKCTHTLLNLQSKNKKLCFRSQS